MEKELLISPWPEWKIRELIGEGSYGKVYKASRMEGRKEFFSAIKLISIPGSSEELKSIQRENNDPDKTKTYFETLVKDCVSEIATMEYFRGNSHIVSVEDYKVEEYLDSIGWNIYIRMEYLTPFLDYCQDREPGEDTVIRLGMDLCKALSCCEKIGIVHRDIKPENIFVSAFGEFKLGDFGVAKELLQTSSEMSKKGTYAYMAPEIYHGGSCDQTSDIYSLGLVLYRLMNRNRMPFVSLDKQLITYRDKEQAGAQRFGGAQLPLPVSASPEFAKVILKACAYRKEDRYQTAEEFEKALSTLESRSAQQERKKPAAMPEAKAAEVKKRVLSVNRSKNRKRKQREPLVIVLVIAVLAMAFSLCAISLLLIRQMGTSASSAEVSTADRILGQSEEDGNKKLGAALSEIRTAVSDIEDSIDTYNWIGNEESGRVTYLDQKGKVVKVKVFPSSSEEDAYEEYYYKEETLIFAYIWKITDQGTSLGDHYYYQDGSLIRWIDQTNVCHDYEEDNEEFVERGNYYKEKAQSQINSST